MKRKEKKKKQSVTHKKKEKRRGNKKLIDALRLKEENRRKRKECQEQECSAWQFWGSATTHCTFVCCSTTKNGSSAITSCTLLSMSWTQKVCLFSDAKHKQQQALTRGTHHICMSTVAGNSEGRYLGLLEAQENYKVYGYITCTQTKFIVVFDDVPINETVAKDVCFFHKKKQETDTMDFTIFSKHKNSSLTACTPSTQTRCQTRSMCRTRR